ncbi:MAG: hypothetical protein IJX76_07425 [Clostridia bacterium]|nr:hypothetical protein [Clostridia bacterium]
MKRTTIIFLLLFALLLTGCADDAEPTDTTTAVTTVRTAEPTPIWEKVEIYEGATGDWLTADSMEALSNLLTEFMARKIGLGSDKISFTFRMRGYIEVTEPFEEAFASVKNKEIGAWNDDRDPYVHTMVTLRYEDVNLETIWSLAQDQEILLVQIKALNVGHETDD